MLTIGFIIGSFGCSGDSNPNVDVEIVVLEDVILVDGDRVADPSDRPAKDKAIPGFDRGIVELNKEVRAAYEQKGLSTETGFCAGLRFEADHPADVLFRMVYSLEIREYSFVDLESMTDTIPLVLNGNRERHVPIPGADDWDDEFAGYGAFDFGLTFFVFPMNQQLVVSRGQRSQWETSFTDSLPAVFLDPKAAPFNLYALTKTCKTIISELDALKYRGIIDFAVAGPGDLPTSELVAILEAVFDAVGSDDRVYLKTLRLAKKTRVTPVSVAKALIDIDAVLLWAVEKGNLESAKAGLKAGADVNVVDESGQSPLILAAWDDNLEMTDLLLNQGADVNYKSRFFGIEGALSIAVLNDRGRSDRMKKINPEPESVYERLLLANPDQELIDQAEHMRENPPLLE